MIRESESGTQIGTQAGRQVGTQRLSLPLAFAVTGHRSLRENDLPALRNALRAAMLERNGNGSLPFVLLSCLAEGADRVAAEEALALGGGLIAVLPMPAEMYRLDFDREAERDRFDKLRERAVREIRIGDALPDLVQAAGSGDTKARTRLYAAAGACCARLGQVLFAVWDGSPVTPSTLGGTAHIVHFSRTGGFGGVPARDGTSGSERDAATAVLTERMESDLRRLAEPLGLPRKLMECTGSKAVVHFEIRRP